MDGSGILGAKASIGDVIRHWAAIQPNAPALVAAGNIPLSYGGLVRLIDRTQLALAEAGLGPGSRIAILHPGGPEMAALLLGAMTATVAVPINPASTPDELSARLYLCQVDAVIAEESLVEQARDVVLALGIPVFQSVTDDSTIAGMASLRRIKDGKAPPSTREQPGDVAVVLASSGTTADAKIIPIRHGQILARSLTTARMLDLTPDDRGLNFNKLFLHGGLANMCVCLFAGGSVISMTDFDTRTFFEYLTELKPTWYAGSFTVNKAIYEAAMARPRPLENSRLRLVRTTSGAIESQIADNLEALLGVPVIEAYSTTETGRIAGNPQPPGVRKRGTVGPVMGCEVIVSDELGNQLGPHEKGEIVVRGPGVFDGYENNPAANRAAFRDGWYRTGDEGFFDEDGYLTLTGRIKETINRGGEKVLPLEVDQALEAHPDIAEAAAFGLPHPTLGEVVVAAVVPMVGKSPTKQMLTRFLADRLTQFKIPRAIFIIDQIPRGPTGKILRGCLSAQFAKKR